MRNSSAAQNGHFWSGYLWPVMILVALSLVLIFAIGSLVLEGFKPKSVGIAALSKHSESLAQRILPSLVRVHVTKRESSRITDDLAILFGDSLALPREDLGSGMFIDSDGLVLTNFHVVRDAATIDVVDYQGRRTVASLVGADPLTDLAVIKTSVDSVKPIQWEETESLSVGALVWAFGCPFGLENSVTLGIVSSNRNPAISESPFQEFIQTDVATNPGSSGGPLVNIDGKVVGVNTAIAGEKFQGVSFALPSSLAHKVASELSATGNIERGWLGVELSAVDSERARRAGLDSVSGVYIQTVAHDHIQTADGLKAGDICLEIDGKSVNDPVMFSRAIAATRIGRQIQLTVQRDGQRVPITMRVSSRPRNENG